MAHPSINPKAFPQDMKSHLLFRCSGSHAKEIWRTQDVDGLLIMVTMVVCLSFLSIFTVPIGLEKKLGLAGAREAMYSVGFVIFVVMNTVSFFSSLGVVSVMMFLQAMAIDNISKKGVMRMCDIVAQIALGCATIAFVSAVMIFMRHL
ncbi:hypothetical protein SUGI_0639160 [Cryptomeria japonica]|nr:hypothetical protein SUGI_0639160 [Cryptomeria japonica]